MKKLLLTALLLLATQVFASSNTYSTTTGKMLVPNVIVDGVYFSNVALTLKLNTRWTVDTATPGLLNLDNAEWPMVSFTSSNSTAVFSTLNVDDVPMQNITLVLSPDGSWSSNLPQTAKPSVPVPVTPVPTPAPAPTPAPVTPSQPNYNFTGTWVSPQSSATSWMGQTLKITQTTTSMTFEAPSLGKSSTFPIKGENTTFPQSSSTTVSSNGGTVGVTVTLYSDSHLAFRLDSCTAPAGYYCKIPAGTVNDYYKQK